MTFEEIEASIKTGPALADTPDPKDFLAGAILDQPTALPGTFDLRGQLSSVRSQGVRGTCTAHATCAVAEYFNRKEWGDPSLDLSEEFLFKKTKDIDMADYGYTGYGAYMRSAAKAIQKYGACKEASMPYQVNAPENVWQSETTSAAAEAEGVLYRVSSYASVDTNVDAIRSALVQTNAPIMGGFMLYSSYRAAKTNGGFMPVPSASEAQVGGHAMAIVGYTGSHFVLKNSWGNAWGDGGYVYYPYGALDKAYSLWSFVDESNGNVIGDKLKEANLARVSAWALDAWKKADAKGVVLSNTDPKGVMTKEELMTFLDRSGLLKNAGEGSTAAIAKNRTRVSSWAMASWDKAISAKVVQDSTDPAATTTKEELAVFFDRLGLLKNAGGASTPAIERNKKLLSPWAAASWSKAISAKLIQDSTLPKATMTKEEFMTFLVRAGAL